MAIIFFLGWLGACTRATDRSSSEQTKDSVMLPQGDSQLNSLDTHIEKRQIEDTLKQQLPNNNLRTVQKPKEAQLSYQRYSELPSDNNWNGKPMTQQIELPQKILQENPDTLSRLAVAQYKTYDAYFPKSIADNFEEGISHEFVEYPKKLIFSFQVFEDGFSGTPYHTKNVVIRRNEKGEPYAE